MPRPRTRPENPTAEYFKGLIRRTLRNYPNITVSMLGSHVRPYGKEWREALEQMVEAGDVLCERRIVEGRGVFTYSLKKEVPEPAKSKYMISRAG